MIIRRRHTANFTTIGNELFNDERLEADEVGVLAFLLSRPDDWEVRRPALARRFRVGRDSIRRVIRNSIRYGWIIAKVTRLANGTVHVIYEVRDAPGQELTEDEARAALSLVSSDAGPGESVESSELDEAAEGVNSAPPDTPQPQAAYRLRQTHPGSLLNIDSLRTESTQIEREADCGHDRKARFIAAFEMRWPTAATDDRARTAKAARSVPDEEETPALDGIGPFLEKLKRDGRKHVPAGWKYLEQQPWKLLVPEKTPGGQRQKFAASSAEAKAIEVLHAIAGKTDFLQAVMRSREDGGVYYLGEIAPRLVALAEAPPSNEWAILNRQQAGAWNDLLGAFLAVQSWNRLTEGKRAPWRWPPRKDGTLSPTGPPEVLMTEQDEKDLDQLGKMTG